MSNIKPSKTCVTISSVTRTGPKLPSGYTADSRSEEVGEIRHASGDRSAHERLRTTDELVEIRRADVMELRKIHGQQSRHVRPLFCP